MLGGERLMKGLTLFQNIRNIITSNNYNDNYKDRCLTDVYNHSLFLLDG